jgi:hypothetical protein
MIEQAYELLFNNQPTFSPTNKFLKFEQFFNVTNYIQKHFYVFL